MQNMRLLEDIFVRDPYFVRAEKGWLLFLSHDKAADDSYEGVDVCFSADGVLWSEPQPALRQPVQNRTYWATEIHPWQGAWYMFVTLTGVMPGCGIDTPLGNEMIRGTWIFRSEKPEGPYKAWTEGPIQPMEHLTLDGTLYVSPEGKPYMVYCHEWLQVKDGTVEAVEMSADLKQAASEPFVLFNASDAPWSTGMYVAEALGIRFDCTCRVTDGCFFSGTSPVRCACCGVRGMDAMRRVLPAVPPAGWKARGSMRSSLSSRRTADIPCWFAAITANG